MEFVALGVLGMLGYMSAAGKQQSTKPPKPQTPTKRVHFKDLEKDFSENVKDHMASESTVMPFNDSTTVTNFRPFFTSEKNQNTNDDFKNRRLGTFTGVDNVDYHKKQEVQAAPPVKNLSHVNGVAFQPDIERYKQYTVSCRNHNVTPVEKQYVGPGLGIDPSVAAEGGFHQSFRILPDNVNGYRKNTFGGEIVHGKSVINQRESDGFADTRDILGSNLTAEEQASIGNRPLEAPHGSSTSAPSARYDAKASLHTNNNRSMEGVCNPGTLTGAVDATYQFGDATRHNDRTFACNVTGGAFRGVNGGYNDAQYFATETERETANNQHTNVHGNQFASYIYGQTDTHTLRENASCPNQQYGGAHPTEGGATSRIGVYARPTQKEQLNSEFFGISGSGVSNAHTVVDDTLSRSTMRGDTNNRYQSGPASAHVSGFTNYQTMYQGSTPNASRELATMTNYTHNGQKPNLMLGAHQMANTVTSQRIDENDNRVCSNPQGLGVQNFTNSQHIGSVYAYGQQTSENHRDFGYAPTNPLVTNILKK